MGDRAPQFIGRTIHIAATVSEQMGDGVIVAQGGNALGFSLYIKENKLCFAVRHSNKPEIISSSGPLPAGALNITADLEADGGMTLTLNDQKIATGNCPGLLERQPAEGLQVGRDKGNAVGDYRSPVLYRGKIEQVSVTLGKTAEEQ